ncbi:MAG: redoxin domain-containing protein [Draconibacterium sp.]
MSRLKLQNNNTKNLRRSKLIKLSILLAMFVVIVFIISGLRLNANHTGAETNSVTKKIEVGDTIPNIVLKDQSGELFDLKAQTEGKNIVLYFYPMDDTKGCTAQACAFRDQFEDFVEANAVVVGISGQSVESHANFVSKYNLPFTLLSDEGNEVRKLFGVPSNLFGMFPGRVTYVINKEYKVVYIFNSQTKIKEHIENSLNKLNSE